MKLAIFAVAAVMLAQSPQMPVSPADLALTIDPSPLPPLVVSVTPGLISMNAYAFESLPSEAYTIASLWSMTTDNGTITVGTDADGNPACGYTASLDMADDFELSGYPSPCVAGAIAQPLATVTVTAGGFAQ